MRHFLETEVPKFHVDIGIQVFMLPAETIASRVIHPNIESRVCKKERDRIFSIATYPSSAI